jgi:hypothetical protein
MSTCEELFKPNFRQQFTSVAFRRQIWLVGVVDISVDSSERDLSTVFEFFFHVVADSRVSDIGIAALECKRIKHENFKNISKNFKIRVFSKQMASGKASMKISLALIPEK